MAGRRKLPDPLLNHILNALSIGVQYTLSFQLTNFGWSAYFEDFFNKPVYNFDDVSKIGYPKSF